MIAASFDMYVKATGLQLIYIAGKFTLYNTIDRTFWVMKKKQFLLISKIIIFASKPKSLREIESKIASCNNTVAQANLILQYLIDQEILVGCRKEHGDTASWQNAGWSLAQEYHLHCINVRYLDYSKPGVEKFDVDRMRGFMAESPRPSNYKKVESILRLKIEDHNQTFDISVKSLFEINGPAIKRHLDLSSISSLTLKCFGETAKQKMKASGEHIRKRSPSGGSRHPTEVYILSVDIAGLEKGLYHFNVEQAAFDLIKSENTVGRLQKAILTNERWRAFNPTAIMILTSLPERSMHRYRDSRSYRVLHHDVGHLLQSIHFYCRLFGLEALTTYSANESLVNEILEIDGLLETPLAFAALR